MAAAGEVGGCGAGDIWFNEKSNFYRRHQSMRRVKRLHSAHTSGNFEQIEYHLLTRTDIDLKTGGVKGDFVFLAAQSNIFCKLHSIRHTFSFRFNLN